MKLLFICQWFPPEHTPIGYMLKELAEDLTAHGHQVTIITGYPNHPSGVVYEGYVKRFRSIERQHGLTIIRCYLYTSPKKSIARRLLNFLSFAGTSFLTALTLERQDLLFMVSPPLTNGLMAWLLYRLRGLRYIFNVQDIYPDAAIEHGILSNRLLIAVLQRLERLIYRNAAMNVVISEGFRSNLRAKKVSDKAIAVIGNWIDTNEIVPLQRDNPFAMRHGLTEKFVVLYAGTIGLISGAGIMLEVARKLRHYPDILFLFVGEGVVAGELAATVAHEKLEQVKMLPFQPRALLPEVLSSADLTVVTLLKEKARTSVPSKVIGYMAAARPVVASVDRDSDTWRLVEEAGAGMCTEAEDADALATAILSFYNNRDMVYRCGANARHYLLQHHSRSSITARYEALFTSALA